MSSGMYGADVEALRSLAGRVADGAQALELAAAAIETAVGGARWEGSDATEFRTAWTATLRPSLTGTAALLTDAADLLRGNAEQQDATSRDGGAGGPGGPGSPGGPGGPGSPGGPGGPVTQGGDGGPPDWLVPPSWLSTDMTQGGVLNWFASQGVDAWTAMNKLDDPLNVAGLADNLASAGKVLKGAGFVFDGYSVYSGSMQAWEGFAEGDGFKGTDGVITAGLGAAGIGAAIFLASNPVGWAIAGAGAVWGIATLLSGDVPVTKRIADGAGWLWDRGGDLADGAADLAGDVWDAGGDFVDGATETLKKAWPW